ncbi:hypothetical protein [Rudanella lutea]|uniref:hypothetical protein n=1 Tax=Rudanella lutea TaxID=451374 RepID=UPI00035FDA6C|nr:hypothetical protein [Rudanella lutea]
MSYPQHIHPLQRLRAEVTYIADFGEIRLPSDGMYAFRLQISDPGGPAGTLYHLSLYFGSVLEDKVELSFPDDFASTTTVGAWGRAGQPVSVCLVQQLLNPWRLWTNAPPIARPNLRGVLLRYWRVDEPQTGDSRLYSDESRWTNFFFCNLPQATA